MKDVPAEASVYAKYADGIVSGQAVNSYSGSYEAKSDGSLTIGQISSTLMAGPPAVQAVETAYFAALQKTASYTADGSKLTLFDADGAELLVFEKYEVSIVGSWDVTGINNGKEAVVSVISTSTVTIVFADDDKVSGNAGVNQYNGSYKTTGTDGIQIGPLASTQMAGEPDLMEQEQAFLTAMQASKTWEIRGETLTMRDESGATQITATLAK
jgi:putative lipoprotein